MDQSRGLEAYRINVTHYHTSFQVLQMTEFHSRFKNRFSKLTTPVTHQQDFSQEVKEAEKSELLDKHKSLHLPLLRTTGHELYPHDCH